jgi:hypothetical protein
MLRWSTVIKLLVVLAAFAGALFVYLTVIWTLEKLG